MNKNIPPAPPKKSPWNSGSFYLFAGVAILLALGSIASSLSVVSLLITSMISIIILITIGILQLKQDNGLKEASFMQLMEAILKRLSLFGGVLKDWIDKKSNKQ